MTTIERRERITLGWRPGTPARRVDDFAEVPHLAVAAKPPTPHEPERREIGARLENWARYCTQSSREIEVTPIGRLYDISRRAENIAAGIADERSGDRRAIDEQDAWRLEQVMRIIEPRHRELLRWCYIRQAQPEVVCRRMGIARRPMTVFIDLFRQAQAAVESAVELQMGERK